MTHKKPIFRTPREALDYHTSGAVERGEAVAIVEQSAIPLRIKTNELVNGHRIRCYDMAGDSLDRYTVAYIDQPENGGCVAMLGMSERPFHPQGFCQHTSGHSIRKDSASIRAGTLAGI